MRAYSPELELLRERRSRLRAAADPRITAGRYGRPLAHVPGGADVLPCRTMDWRIRAIPQEG